MSLIVCGFQTSKARCYFEIHNDSSLKMGEFNPFCIKPNGSLIPLRLSAEKLRNKTNT